MSTQQTTGPDLGSLNEEQRAAVEHTGGALAVLAGPGTGKTRVIVSRIARLVTDGAPPESIVGLTFSIKAAREMQERLIEMLGPRDGAQVTLSTFHAWGRRFLARYGDTIGHRVTPRIMDSARRNALLSELIVEGGLFTSARAMGVERAVEAGIHFIERSIDAGREASEAVEFAREFVERDRAEMDPDDRDAALFHASQLRDAAELYARYERACAERGLVSISDFVIAPVRILRRDELVRTITRSEIKHVVVDEFQDVNLGQIELLKLLCPPEMRRDLCVVGDDDQAIYGFRGSDERAFARFAEIWQDHATQPLVTNYRSTRSIVDLTTRFIKESASRFEPDKTLRAYDETSGEPVRCVTCETADEFGVVTASLIRDAQRRDKNLKLRDIAVIARTHNNLADVESELRIADIPVSRGRESSALDDLAVADLFAWMRLIADGSGASDVMRLIRRPLFGVSTEEVAEWSRAWRRDASAARHAGGRGEAMFEWLASNRADDERVARFVALVRGLREKSLELSPGSMAIEILRAAHVVESSALTRRERARRVRTVARVLRFIRSCEDSIVGRSPTLASFLDHYDRLDEHEQKITETRDDRVAGDGGDESETEDAVQLITAHASKGLEFKLVLAVNVSPRGFPADKRARDEPLELPGEYTRAAPTDHDEEQRRLFYVTMTRAEQELVLLAKRKKKRGSVIDYFYEITEDFTEQNVLPLESSEILEKDDSAMVADPVDLYLAKDKSLTPSQVRALRRERTLREELLELSYAVLRAEEAERDRIATRCEKLVREIASVATARDDESPLEDETGYPGLASPLELSYTTIKDYTRCPRCFYAKHVLRIPDDPSPGMHVGLVVHETLEKFFHEVRDFDAGDAPGRDTPPDETRLIEIARAMYDASIAREGGGGVRGPGLPDEGEWEMIDAQLRTALRDLHDPAANIVEIEKKIAPIPLPVGEHTHTLTAKIDRIDQMETPDGIAYRIIDYKTSRPSKGKTSPDKKDFQLGIYLKAIMWYYGMDEPPDGGAEYWVLQSGERGVLPFDEINMKSVDNKIEKAVKGMLNGDWKQGSKCSGFCEVIQW